MKDKETYLRNFDKAFQEDAYASRLNQDLSRNKPQAISVADSQLASQNDTIGNGFF